MFAVAAFEMVFQSGSDFPCGAVGIEMIITGVVHVIHQSGLYGKCPCFAFTQVEVEIQSYLGGRAVDVVSQFFIDVIMQPADTEYGFHFKSPGHACVGAEEVVQIDHTQQADVGIVDSCAAYGCIEASHGFHSDAEAGSQLFGQS